MFPKYRVNSSNTNLRDDIQTYIIQDTVNKVQLQAHTYDRKHHKFVNKGFRLNISLGKLVN